MELRVGEQWSHQRAGTAGTPIPPAGIAGSRLHEGPGIIEVVSPSVRRLSVVLLLLPVVAPRSTWAQFRASPFGTVSQRIDSTIITVEYYRPSVRGRAIFGRLVKWGEVWTPGANW